MKDQVGPYCEQINEELELVVKHPFSNSAPEVSLRGRFELTRRARLAVILIEKWGMVAGKVDGEDSAGRSKLELQTPEEVVARACETSERAWAEFEKRGWVFRLPSYEEAAGKLNGGASQTQ